MLLRSLLETNSAWLRQAAELLGSLDDRAYTTSPTGLEPHRAGGHLRHILEFYECFLEGCARGYVDYDSRRRDTSVETNRFTAIARLREVNERLTQLHTLEYDRRIWVRAEAITAPGILGNILASSVGRELQVLSSHTVHHFALMAITLRAHGVSVPSSFGVAPSTLLHQAAASAASKAA